VESEETVKNKKDVGQKAVKIRWPIGFKLVVIISISGGLIPRPSGA
jgi:hypothetical protein